MDFFEAQDRARRKTKTLVLLFILGTLATGLAIYLVVAGALHYLSMDDPVPTPFWDWRLLGWTVGLTTALMAGASLLKIGSLKSGGGAVARMLGGTRVEAAPKDPALRRYRNVVEEMAIAAGIHIPEIYVLENEASINAFAAGYTLDNAAVAVSRGCLEQLSREELQGVVAHEYSHILNGDMRLNTRLVGIVFGILVIAVLGRILLSGFGRATLFGGARRSRGSDSKGGGGAMMVILAAAFAVMLIGYIGVLFGRLIQSAISRQREYLADAAAVQFTRNPSGITNALRRIKAYSEGSRIQHPDAVETGHMFFANALKSRFGGGFATHPPLEARIKALDPSGLHARPLERKQPSPEPAPKKQPRESFVHSIAKDPIFGAVLASSILQSLPEPVSARARDPSQAIGVIAGCIDPLDTKLMGRRPKPEERFALVELALAALKHLPEAELAQGLSQLRERALADQQINFEEQCLLLAVERNLSDWKRNATGKPRFFPAVKGDIETILSAIALLDEPDPALAAAPFDKAQAAFRGFGATLQPDFAAAQDPDRLNAALLAASSAIFNARKALIDGASRIAAHDDSLSETEQSRIRALALALACPLPQASGEAKGDSESETQNRPE